MVGIQTQLSDAVRDHLDKRLIKFADVVKVSDCFATEYAYMIHKVQLIQHL